MMWVPRFKKPFPLVSIITGEQLKDEKNELMEKHQDELFLELLAHDTFASTARIPNQVRLAEAIRKAKKENAEYYVFEAADGQLIKEACNAAQVNALFAASLREAMEALTKGAIEEDPTTKDTNGAADTVA